MEQLCLLGLPLLFVNALLASREQLAGAFQQLLFPLAHLNRVHSVVSGDLLDRLAATDRLHGDPGLELWTVGAAFAHWWEPPLRGDTPPHRLTMGTVQKNQTTSHSDPLKDGIIELARILEVSYDTCEDYASSYLRNSEEFYASYASGDTSIQLSVKKRAPAFLIGNLTQSHRIPYMTWRFDWYLERLEELGTTKGDCLDYGGGGGKDSIILQRFGFNVHYCDLLSEPFSGWVGKRFELRNLDIPMRDVRDNESRRYKLINCQDVIEHCYDVESVIADISSRLENNGVLLMAPTFTFEYDNDHLDKNTAYLEWFPELCEVAGLRLVARMNWNTHIYIRTERPESQSISEEAKDIGTLLYKKSQDKTLGNALTALNKVIQTKQLNTAELNAVSDNLAIFRLCTQRLKTIEDQP